MQKILFALVLFSCFSLRAQGNDSSVRRYFVCESAFSYDHGIYRFNRIFKNGQRIWIQDITGKKIRGRIAILNDSLFEVHNHVSGKRDTFHCNELSVVKKPSMLKEAGVVLFLGSGAALIVMGISAIETSVYFQNHSSTAFLSEVYLIAGVGLLCLSLASVTAGVLSLFGKKMYPHNHKFRIVKTRGYRLKKKQIRSL